MKSNRRSFLRQASVAAGAAIAGSGASLSIDGGRGRILFAQDSSISKGESYTARVHDTLDLVDYGNYAINGMTQTLDPKFNYEIFFRVQLGTSPPYLQHDTTGLPTINPKYGESLPMMRVMTGSSKYADIDQKLMQMMMDNTAEDGLYYARYELPLARPYPGRIGRPAFGLWPTEWPAVSPIRPNASAAARCTLLFESHSNSGNRCKRSTQHGRYEPFPLAGGPALQVGVLSSAFVVDSGVLRSE